MKLKKQDALSGIDMIIAIVVIIIFSTLMLSLITNNALENVKNAKESMAILYMTEIFENIAIADYKDVLQENVNNFIPQEVLNNYKVGIKINKDFEEIEDKEQDIVKKVYITLTYEIGDKKYSCSMERLKIKE